jgi:hypothetical protein
LTIQCLNFQDGRASEGIASKNPGCGVIVLSKVKIAEISLDLLKATLYNTISVGSSGTFEERAALKGGSRERDE